MALDKVVGYCDELGFQLVGRSEEFVFGVSSTLLAFRTVAAEEVLLA
jgi:hypothetical protein